MPPCRLVRKIDLLLRGLLAGLTANYSYSALARQNLRITTALHCLLDPLRRNALLHELIANAVQLIVALAIDFDQLLAAPVPVRFGLDLVVEDTPIKAGRALV